MPYRTPDDPRKQRRLPMLDRLSIKTPCTASWDAMVGDERVRLCCQCNRNVYDLTAMHPDEAEAFLDEHLATHGTLPCARLHRRPDGRVMTSRCPTAADRLHRQRTAAAIAVAAIAAVAGAHAVITHVPKMLDDDVITIERPRLVAFDPPAEKVEPAIAMGALVAEDQDQSELLAKGEEPLPTFPTTIHGTIALRSDKSPLERIARAPK